MVLSVRFFAPILLTLRAENVYCLRNRLRNLVNALSNPNDTEVVESAAGGMSAKN